MPELTVAVVGGTGYTGRDLCRLLLQHPHVGRILPTARGAERFDRVHPGLRGCGLEFVAYQDVVAMAGEVDVAFFCTPSGEAMRHTPELLAADVRVVDVSADFRFRDAEKYQEVYGAEHMAPGLLAEAAPGITELYRDEVRAARLVANPGCYVNTTVLALYPILKAGLVEPRTTLRVHAVNGTTGAGRTPKLDIMHAEATASMLPYSLDGHRHAPELEARFGELTGRDVVVDLATAHGNFTRGIYVQASLQAAGPLSRDSILDVLRDRYAGERFVRVIDEPKAGGRNAKEYGAYPRLAHVIGSNFCDIGADYDAAREIIRVVATLDNLVKGAAGAAVQNMNVMLGLPEDAGVGQYPL